MLCSTGKPFAPSDKEGRSFAVPGVLRWTLYVMAIWSFAWTVYRAFLNVEIEKNEGWNAYFADAAMGKMPFYLSADQLLAGLLKLISKCAEMLSVDIWESVRARAGKIRAQD